MLALFLKKQFDPMISIVESYLAINKLKQHKPLDVITITMMTSIGKLSN